METLGERAEALLAKRRGSRVYAVLIVTALLIGAASRPHVAAARSQAQDTRPFILPFADPPGPSTWLLGQTYGNTVGAYRQRATTYGASQGIHFGIDFSAPCGTELVALADGVVYAADALTFGSAPHNLLIDHPDLGYTVLYGHLLDKPTVTPGQEVT